MRLNRKIEKRDLGMEGGDETLRARARRWRDVRTGVYMLVLQNFSRFFLHLSNFAVSLWYAKTVLPFWLVMSPKL